jgi:mxaJ protein
MARVSNPVRAAGLAGLLLALLAPAWPAAAESARGEFRVCADPNNLPFSNDKGEGFENKLAELIAKELGKRVTYFWWAQRRGSCATR